MSDLFHRIRDAIDEGRYMIGAHADERIRERHITAWQIIVGVAESTLIQLRPNDLPNPSVVVEQMLADGTPVKVVWSWLADDETAKLVTVHFFDR